MASPTVAADSPTVVMVDTMPTGPLRSRTPACPVTSIFRLSRTSRTKSMAPFQLLASRSPHVASFTPKNMP